MTHSLTENIDPHADTTYKALPTRWKPGRSYHRRPYQNEDDTDTDVICRVISGGRSATEGVNIP
ncbi:MAG: hypothetical protein ACLR84_04075 [Clostridia bacterium]